MGSTRTIRTYREGDEEGIFELYKAVYPTMPWNKDQWMKLWHWMYRENPAGQARIHVVEEQGKIIAHRAHIQVELKVANDTIKACQNISFMTHPDSKFKGLYLLERRVVREAVREGLHITFGFPTEAARPGFVKVGYSDFGSMQPMFKPLNIQNTLKTRINNGFLARLCAVTASPFIKTIYRSRKPPVIEGLTINRIDSFDDRFNELWTRVSGSHPIMVVRSKQHLNWRYSPPGIDYTVFAAVKDNEVLGYIVIRYVQGAPVNQVNIYDIVAQSEEVIHCLVAKVVEYSRKLAADFVYCNMIANKEYFRALQRNGFMSTRLIRHATFGAYTSSQHMPQAFIEDPRNWFVQLGDSDAF